MKPLQQVQLGGGSILDADMIEMPARIVVELSGHEAAAVVGDQRRHASGKTAVARRLLPGLLQRRHRIVRRLRRGQVASQQIAGIIVDHRHCIPPAEAWNMNPRHIRLPQVVRTRRQQLEQLGALVDPGLPHWLLTPQQALGVTINGKLPRSANLKFPSPRV